ncbi:aspartic peptidase domain-containing protein [Desarmillaria tabescens]|uniref:Aspartic peptidase domain-containing protein n=1 Tax=Armillaria tabescens TaxID=1929756 RepID=A0AA39U201_ARMTA|nr:aspartic peptidase domain-containing protein [Desarmillaria tabescens]KAK0469109.1 aspartic peptidase domain-containing protein [Desarmillaria tabescens]
MTKFAFGWLAAFVLAVYAADPSWVSLNVTVATTMSDLDYMYSQVPLLFGTLQQSMDLTINLSGDLLSAWSDDCVFCQGEELFDKTLSSTIKSNGTAWPGSQPKFNGEYYSDVVSFGGVITAQNMDFVLVEEMSMNFSARINNGHLGLFVNSTAPRSQRLLTKLWDDGSLLNPVVGLRLDPIKPRLTIGALDPEDYAGEINWVEMETPTADFTNAIKIDGVKGFNGSFLPFGGDLIASLSTFSRNIAVPPNNPYALDDGYVGPVDLINLYPDGGFSFLCNGTELPYVYLTVTINGVDYQVDSQDNMLHKTTMAAAPGFCNVALKNTTADTKPDVVLGQPFLRSVYLAYRFPTDDCPGYYGFTFPSGANRTQEQINQVPTSTPTLSSQCLALTAPTSTPTPSTMSKSVKSLLQTGSYEVFGNSGEGQYAKQM